MRRRISAGLLGAASEVFAAESARLMEAREAAMAPVRRTVLSDRDLDRHAAGPHRGAPSRRCSSTHHTYDAWAWADRDDSGQPVWPPRSRWHMRGGRLCSAGAADAAAASPA
jgi:hypothetical protein